MPWIEDILARLSATDRWGYHAGAVSFTEPAAWSAMALLAHGRHEAARGPLQWLSRVQQPDGSLGIHSGETAPNWPTNLAILAWQLFGHISGKPAVWQSAIDRALKAMLKVRGVTIPRTEQMAHDSTLVGWPWIEGTHSWVEPTAMALMALKSVGRGQHPRAREAAHLLIDRLLPDGGCNYGNTVVLGQPLRPHLQPTGICLLALAGEDDRNSRIPQSLQFLTAAASPRATTNSLCFALLALAAHGRWPSSTNSLLEQAALRTVARDPSPYKLALLALAGQGLDCPLLPLLTRTTVG